MLNPKIKDYINDILRHNWVLKLAIDKAEQQIDREYKRLREDCELTGFALHQNKKVVCEDFTKIAGTRFGAITLLVARIYDMKQEIKENLDKVEGLRNGTIKEI